MGRAEAGAVGKYNGFPWPPGLLGWNFFFLQDHLDSQ
jgi:hypothetical protein